MAKRAVMRTSRSIDVDIDLLTHLEGFRRRFALLRRRTGKDLEVWRERDENAPQLVETGSVALEFRLAGLDQVVERCGPHHHLIEVGSV